MNENWAAFKLAAADVESSYLGLKQGEETEDGTRLQTVTSIGLTK